MKVTHRVLIAVPVGSKLAAGINYAGKTGKSADSDSFTGGYMVGGQEWAVACWGVDSEGQKNFDQLIAAFPGAKVVKWPAKDSPPEAELAKLGITRPVNISTGKVETVKGK